MGNETKIVALKLSDKVPENVQKVYENCYGSGRSYAKLGDLLQITEPEYCKRNQKAFKAFADNPAGYTTAEETNITQNAADDVPIEPIPKENEWRGMGILPEEESPKEEKKAEEAKPAEGVDETSTEEKAEHSKLVDVIKKHLEMEGIDKAVKTDGEKILADLEAALKLEEAAYAWLEKLKPAKEVPKEEAEVKEEEKPLPGDAVAK